MAALTTEAITTVLAGLTQTVNTDSDLTAVMDSAVTGDGVTDLGVTSSVNGGGDDDDNDDDIDKTVLIVICVIIGLLLLVFIVALCKYIEMRRKNGKRSPSSSRSSSERGEYQEYPQKSSLAKYQGSFTRNEPYVASPAVGIDRHARSSKRTSFKEPERGGGTKVYSVPLQADVTLRNGTTPYGVVIGDIGKKTGAPTYTQGVQGTQPSSNQQYGTLPYGSATYQPPAPTTKVSALPSNGNLYQRADGFTVFEPPQGGRNLAAPVPTGPIVPQQADIYYGGGIQAGPTYSDYETVSRVNVNP